MAPATILLLTLGVGVVLAAGERPGPGVAHRPRAAPALAGTTLPGQRYDLAAARGHVVLVNVFASWCGPCRDELPLLVGTGRRWAPQGLQVVGLNLRDGPDAVRALLAEARAEDLTVVPDPEGVRAVEWGVRGVPETFVVDRDGRIVAHQPGVVTAKWLEQHLAPLLGTP
ncbi:cytochrome c biogenesis protein CcmG, thiol:disulfide interchange protein DsbE [Micromonospora pattaloongensis]|uniref:Cytochrome c biogenesis protein CcmG, thiol:disulfide interchange protein DsbE n=1 Tax=Micromonospora pattaloongensis TaxID=405436 RepID=A0A1H3R5S3_9ACTN|nr:TlpA disulfide reductase family protein [Micromonospora pattaloongensis]SDZ20665.1 cytochrome c biogenesis protein CcmG, thiol:disulfide interchange protein DsbE [Micromonospora pattaloongensis]